MQDGKDLESALNRMFSYYRQSKTKKNPNLLSEILKKDTCGWESFNSKLPDIWDFPIYTYYKRSEELLHFKTAEEFTNRFKRKGKFPKDLLWVKQNQGD